MKQSTVNMGRNGCWRNRRGEESGEWNKGRGEGVEVSEIMSGGERHEGDT